MRTPIASAARLTYRGAMVRRAYVLVGLAAGVLMLTLVLSSVSSGPLLGASRLSPVVEDPAQGPPKGPPHPATGKDGPLFPEWVVVGATTLLVLYALGLLALVAASRLRRRVPRAEREPGATEDAGGEGWGTLLAVEMSEAAQEQLGDIRLGNARNAIIACWLRLHTATRRAGLPPSASETPQEFTARALRHLRLDGAAIAELSGLYREARFSEHPISEAQRQQAAAALAVLAEQLSAAPVPG